MKAWVLYGFLFAFYSNYGRISVSVAVCDIFSVKEWPDLENRVRVHSRSLEMAPFDRSPTSLNILKLFAYTLRATIGINITA